MLFTGVLLAVTSGALAGVAAVAGEAFTGAIALQPLNKTLVVNSPKLTHSFVRNMFMGSPSIVDL